MVFHCGAYNIEADPGATLFRRAQGCLCQFRAGALNLDVDPYNSSSLLYTLGAQAAYNWKVSDKVIITPTTFAG